MKLTIERARFSEALSWVGKALPRTSPVPIITGLRMVAEGDSLSLFASNYEVTHQAVIRTEIHDDGTVLVPGALARDLVNGFTAATVELYTDDRALHMKCGRAAYRLPLMPLEEYPNLPVFPETAGRIDADDFALLVKRVKHIIDARHVVEGLQGLRLEAHDGELRAVGTDRRVVSTATALWDEVAPFDTQVSVGGLDQALAGMEGEIEVGFDGTTLGVRDATREVTMRVIAAQYGNWKAALRDADDFAVTADVADLNEAIKRAALAIPHAKAPVWLNIGGGVLEITTNKGDDPDGNEFVELEGDGVMATGAAPAYLTACLATIPTARVQLGFGPSRRDPIVLTPVDDDSLVHIVLPRLPEN